MNTTPPVQTPNNSDSVDTETNNMVTPYTDDIHTTDGQHLPINTNHTATAAFAPDTANNSVSNASDPPQAVQPNSADAVTQDQFPPVLGAPPSVDNSIVGDENVSSVCAVYSGENMSTIEEIEKELGYDIKVPHYIPDDYKTDSLSAPFDEFAQIIYTNETDTLYYRTAKDSEDISGDYNDYTDIETVNINNSAITIKGNNNLYHNASWFSGDETFSIYSNNGIEKDTMINIAESVD